MRLFPENKTVERRWFAVVGASQEIRPNRDGFVTPHVRVVPHFSWAKSEADAIADYFMMVLKKYPGEEFSGMTAYPCPTESPKVEG